MRVALALLILALVCAACSQGVDLPPASGVTPLPHATDGPARPDIPRVNPTIEKTPPASPAVTPPSHPVFINDTHGAPRLELDVPLGDAIGRHHPIIAVEDFPLLRHPPIRVASAQLLGYEESLRFDFGANSTGKILFGKNDDTIGTFLAFQEGKPILEYRARLDAGRFEDLRGRQIQILGHTYLIAEATNTSVHLYGVDIASNLAFTNGTKLSVNSSGQPGTIVRVTPDQISYILYATDEDTDGIQIRPGERLSERISRNRLASRLFDIQYEGAAVQNESTLVIDRTRDGYRLVVDTIRGPVTVPLVEQDAGHLVLGRVGEPLRVTPCPPSQRYCIAPGDLVLLTNPRGASYLLTYDDAKNETKELIVREGSNRYTYRFLGEPGQNAFTDIVIDGWPFRAWVGPRDNSTDDYNITIDQGFVQGRAELVTRAGATLRIGDINATTLPLELRLPPTLSADRVEEKITITITLSGDDGRVRLGGNLTLAQDDHGDLVGMSQYGVGIALDRDGDDLPNATGHQATLLIPASPAYGTIALEG